MKTSALGLCAVVWTAGLVGCASAQPPPQLVDARATYQRASTGPGASSVPADVYDAKKSLDEAERSFADDGDTEMTRSVAYVAQRRAVAVEAKAAAAQAQIDKRTAEASFEQFKTQQMSATRDQLDQTKNALGAAEQEAARQRQARIAAESKTRDLLGQIDGLKTAQTDRGLVLTLSGSVLFATNKSELLPSAKKSLSEVSKALKDDNHNLVVVGHTDSTGGDELNMKLSDARAQSVRRYLVSQGVPEGRIRSEGLGKTQPIADNASPEGRANNRRVEIILENNSQGAATPPTR